ncbi:phage portal protein [Lactococcus lactis]|uniref:phage portal protein n=1 Tax=Lactococcus lactis TaxID=1358 RepID=UPI0032E3C70E
MNLFGKIVRVFTGKLDNKTQRVKGWDLDTASEFTSAFAINIQNKIASEVSKVSFNHVKYKKSENGADTLISMAGSDIDEVLNWSPKGKYNSIEFWNAVVKKLTVNKKIRLVPVYNERTGELLDLRFPIDTDKELSEQETVNLASPFYLNDDTSILDNALSAIAQKLDQGKIRALYKVNAQLDFDFVDEFKEKAMATIESMQNGSTFNGIAPIDSKGEIIELKKDYSVLNKEEIDLIKSELLGAFFMNEDILNGTASQEQQMYFYNSTIIPLLVQLEKELTYKLLTSNNRRVIAGNLYYQRIIIDNQLFKFATLKELIDLYHENTNAPVFTINEMRIKMGEQPIEGGDKYFTNRNAVLVNDLDDLIDRQNAENNTTQKKGTDETS